MRAQVQIGSTNLVDFVLSLGIILFIINFFHGSLLVFFVSCFFLALGIYPRIYLKYAAQTFFYKNEKKKINLTNGDHGELSIQFVNEGYFPVHGVCQFLYDPVIKFDQAEKTLKNTFRFPFYVHGKSSDDILFPFTTLSRGVGRLHHFTLILSDPLKLMTIRLEYGNVRQDIVVYPKRQAVMGLEATHLLQEGAHFNRQSLFYDRSLPIGTREYTGGDSLKAIHWKATARMGNLQTKVMERTMGLTWSFVVLIGSNMKKEDVEKLESQLCSLARLAELAHKRGIDFDLVVNSRPPGKNLIMHTPLGNDRAHYFYIMERLAFIQVDFLRVDAKLAIREMTKSFHQPRVLFFSGAFNEIGNDPILSLWQKQGHRLYQIEEVGMITPVQKGGTRVAY